MKLELYINKTDRQHLDKDLTNKLTLEGNLIDKDVSILNPIITVNFGDINSVVLYNYAIIPEFNNRHYYIDDITNVNKNQWRLHMSIDVLSTYANDIRNQMAIISRQEQSNYNKMYNDGTFKVSEEEVIEIKQFPYKLMDQNAPFYFLTCI